jgi:hypothetical protein
MTEHDATRAFGAGILILAVASRRSSGLDCEPALCGAGTESKLEVQIADTPNKDGSKFLNIARMARALSFGSHSLCRTKP